MTSPAREMFVDEQTLRDLEIFEVAGEGQPLFDELDRTRLTGGRDALRTRFRRPLSRPAGIRAVQDALQFLLRHGAMACPPAGQEAVDGIERYLRSRFVPLRHVRGFRLGLECLWIAVRYPDLLREARDGVRLTIEFVAGLDRFFTQLVALSPPPELARLAAEANELLDQDGVRSLLHQAGRRTTAVRMLLLDRQTRGIAAPVLRGLIRVLHEMDALASMALATSERGFTFPAIVDEALAHIDGEGISHPALRNAIANDLHIGGARRVVFLTGPNMAGKTTYLKSCAITVLLAQIGMGVPAKGLVLAPFDALFTGLYTADDLRAGISFFRAEARRVRRALELLAQRPRAFVLFDEMFKGTNVHDALEATNTVVKAFARQRSGAFIISSHLAELVDSFSRMDQVMLQHFDAVLQDGVPVYEYRLAPGASTQRLGLVVLRQEGVFDLLDRLQLEADWQHTT